MKVNVSIIFINFHSEILIKNLLLNLNKLIDKPELEIIIVNNTIYKNNKRFLSSFSINKIFFNTSNIGFARAANQGAKIAKGEYLLFLNPDTIIKPKAITKMIEFSKKLNADIAGCKLLNIDQTLQPSCGKFPTIANIIFDRIPFVNQFIQTQLIRQKSYYEKAQTPEWISGAFFLVKRSVFEKLGGFGESYFMYVEDIDFCYKAKKAGFRIYYNPDIEITHFDHGKLPERKINKAINMRKGFSIFFKKYKNPLYFSLWKLILFIESFFKPHLKFNL